MMIQRIVLQSCLLVAVVSAWTPSMVHHHHHHHSHRHNHSRTTTTQKEEWQKAIGSAMLVGILATAGSPLVAHADQIGVEKEAPTLYTGETVEVRLLTDYNFVRTKPLRQIQLCDHVTLTHPSFFFAAVFIQICIKRGPLGACTKTEMRTEQNDNDKAKKYFKDPAEKLRERNAVLRGTDNEEEDANVLVEKLKAQTETNKEKNRLAVERKTFENDQVCKI